MLNGKKVIAIYQTLLLHAIKWIATGGVVVVALILVLGIADRTISGLNWNYGWEGIAFGFVQLVVFAVVRRIVVNALNRSR